MKKFLSLLLALTMVLSLTVLPARAADGITGTLSVEKGQTTTLTAPDKPSKVSVDGKEYTVTSAEPTYNWTSATTTVATVPENSNNNTVSVSGVAAGTSKITCEMTVTYDIPADSVSGTSASTGNHKITKEATVTVTDCTDGVASISFNGVTSNVTNKQATIYTTKSDQALDENATGLTAIPKSNYALNTSESNKIHFSENKLTVPIKANVGTGVGSTEITISKKVVGAPTNLTVTAPDSADKYFAGQNITFAVTAPTDAPDNGITYEWSYNVKDNNTKHALTGTGTSITTKALGTSVDTTYVISCVAKINGVATTPVTKEIIVKADPYVPTRDARDYPYSFTLTRSSAVGSIQTKTLYSPYLQSASDKITSGFNVTWSSSNQNVATVSGGVVSAGSTTGTATISAVITYNGKTYPAVTYTVNNYVLSADLTRQVYYGNPVTYSYSDLIEAANKALSGSYGYGSYYGTVTTIVSASAPVSLSNLGTFTGSISNNSGYIYATASYSGRGKAPITATVKTSTGQPVTVTLNIPVVPIPRTFDSLTAEPVTTNYTTSINNYRITFPSTYSTYYVVQKNGTTAPDYATVSLGNPYSAGSQYTLSSADFGTNGTCTLYVIATNNYTYGSSYGMYYSGAITVSQTNYNINYNGVAGETVQFKHADFTNFMNEVSQARGDASKTGSYPYVTFNYVTFNYPTSTQGTLYYNGTAMSNSSYSGSFNSRTQITNLDNVTFVPYARTSAKSIPLTFTLSVTKYGANGAVVNRDLKYTGTVVVSIVREDIKYTAAPGDTIRFTDSDFLNYLRTQNGFNSNYYSIDYVTFDQSAVNALNEGVLYAYSTGYNAVKTTDKFYYTTTSYNQNALSDVTFRASAYAKTGTTVYIPFTIYARYGTTGTGTRQVSGTVAIKLAQTMNFVDVKPTDYFYDSVKWAVNSNITKGTSATTFSPYKTCTRAEIVTFLWRAAGSKTPTITRNPFTDVAPSMGMDYYYAILWASQNGIAAGTSATTFSPNATCTRAQIVTFLWRYSNKPAGYYSNPFTDVNKAEHAAYYDAILWAVGKGITKGTTATTFSPYGTCTRGEAVTFLYRAVNGK